MKPKYSKTAAKAIEKINNPDKQRIRDAINKIPYGDVRKLTGYTNAYRLRIGNYRILFDMDKSIEITNILPRGGAYKK